MYSILCIHSTIGQDIIQSYFKRWDPNNKIKSHSIKSPIKLLLLGSLRYLGRDWIFDDLQESTGISIEVHRLFFYTFVMSGKYVLYPEYVIYPKTSDESNSHIREFEITGLTGAI